MGTIALMTDFGEQDSFVGMMKGVIAGRAPEVAVIDISHEIASFDIHSAAFLLQRSFHYFPPRTVFVVVIDPGVGTERKIIGAAAGGYFFVAPDNGVLSYTLSQFPERKIVSIENLELLTDRASSTFHGRDIMAPAAAHISGGGALADLGPVLGRYTVLLLPNLLKHERSVIGEIVYVDKFGNMISNIAETDLPSHDDLSELSCRVGDFRGLEFVTGYANASGLAAIVSGFGTVEVFLYRGRAAERFQDPIGTAIAVER
jgi:hypothetical protein